MLTNRAIARKIFETLRDSAAIRAKAEELYGKPHSVYLGFSGSKAPAPENYPAFEIVSWNKERGQNRDSYSFTFSLLLSLEDALLEDGITTAGIYTEVHQGPEAAEELLDMALTAIRGMGADLDFDDLSFDYDPIEYFPLFVGVLTLTITFPALIGGFEPTL